MKFATTLALLVFFVCLDSLAQTNPDVTMSKRFFTVEDGIGSRQILAAVRDSSGFLWVGTRDGFSRYDGENFLVFTRQRHGLQGSRVVQLAVDDANRLYIQYGEPGAERSTNGAIDIMDLATHRIQSLTKSIPDMPFKEPDVILVSNDYGTDRMVFLTGPPLRLWHYTAREGFRLRHEFPNPNPYHTHQHYLARCIFRNGYATLLAEERWYYVTPDSVLGLPPNLRTDYFDYSYRGLTPDNHARLHYRKKDQPNRNFFGVVDPKGNVSYTSHEQESKTPEMLAQLDWVLTSINDESCVITFHKGDKYFYSAEAGYIPLLDAEERINLQGVIPHFLFADPHGWHWLCTSEGLFQIKIEKKRFKNYFTYSENDTLFYDLAMRGIYVDDGGRIYANSHSGLLLLEGDRMQNIFPGGMGYALLKHNDRLFTGMYAVYEIGNGPSRALDDGKGGETWGLYALDSTHLLKGSTEGIMLLDLETRQSEFTGVASPDIPNPVFGYRFFKSRDGTLWAVAGNGLYVLDSRGRAAEYYGNTPDSTHRLPYSNLHDVYEDTQGYFWIATNGEGLFRWDRKKHGFKQFTTADGFPSNILYCIQEDEFQNLWISSDYGLIRFNTRTNRAYTYTKKDGLVHNEFNRTSSYKAADGRMFFGTTQGLTAFYPKDFVSDTSQGVTPLRITHFSQFSASADTLVDKTADLLATNEIVLFPGDRFFSVEFGLLDYQEGLHRFAYQIVGSDNQWNYIDQNTIRVSGLPYGDYTLRIRGQSPDGQWSKMELAIPIRVLAPFYKKAWFYILLLILTAALTYAVVYLRLRQLRKAKQVLENTVLERTQRLREALNQKDTLLKELHHRVKNNLATLSSILYLQSTKSPEEETRKVLRDSISRVKAVALVHETLYRIENLERVRLKPLCTDLAKLLVRTLATSGQEMEVQVEGEDTELAIELAVPISLILNELISNSLKHSVNEDEKGTICITLQPGSGELAMTYTDSGPGLPHPDLKAYKDSLGIRLILILTEQLGGTLAYASTPAPTFAFVFPVASGYL